MSSIPSAPFVHSSKPSRPTENSTTTTNSTSTANSTRAITPVTANSTTVRVPSTAHVSDLRGPSITAHLSTAAADSQNIEENREAKAAEALLELASRLPSLSIGSENVSNTGKEPDFQSKRVHTVPVSSSNEKYPIAAGVIKSVEAALKLEIEQLTASIQSLEESISAQKKAHDAKMSSLRERLKNKDDNHRGRKDKFYQWVAKQDVNDEALQALIRCFRQQQTSTAVQRSNVVEQPTASASQRNQVSLPVAESSTQRNEVTLGERRDQLMARLKHLQRIYETNPQSFLAEEQEGAKREQALDENIEKRKVKLAEFWVLIEQHPDVAEHVKKQRPNWLE